jgi:hypothetical protein
MNPSSIPWQLRALGLIGFIALMLWGAVAVAAADDGDGDEPWFWWSHASAYGSESIWDGGYWSDGRWRGYYGHTTAWGWHCGLPEHFDADNPYYTWAVFTPESMTVANLSRSKLGTWVEFRLPRPDGSLAVVAVPVTDAGPYAWWSYDLAEPVIQSIGWAHAGPPRYGPVEGPVWGRRDVQVRALPEFGRYCPRAGDMAEPPRRLVE